MVVSIVAMTTGTGDGVAATGATLLNTIVTEAGNGEDEIYNSPRRQLQYTQNISLNNDFSETPLVY